LRLGERQRSAFLPVFIALLKQTKRYVLELETSGATTAWPIGTAKPVYHHPARLDEGPCTTHSSDTNLCRTLQTEGHLAPSAEPLPVKGARSFVPRRAARGVACSPFLAYNLLRHPLGAGWPIKPLAEKSGRALPCGDRRRVPAPSFPHPAAAVTEVCGADIRIRSIYEAHTLPDRLGRSGPAGRNLITAGRRHVVRVSAPRLAPNRNAEQRVHIRQTARRL